MTAISHRDFTLPYKPRYLRHAPNSARMKLNFLSGVLDSRITFSRGTGATRVNELGLIELVGNTTPRFDYDPVTLAPRGLLIEEARTNLFLQSESFNSAPWGVEAATVTANNVISPDGTLDADTVIPTTALSTIHRIGVGTTAASGTYTLTVYGRPAGYSWLKLRYGSFFANFNVTTGVVGNVGGVGAVRSITLSDDGWYRCVLTTGTTAGSDTAYIYVMDQDNTGLDAASFAGDGTSGISLYGAQLEAGAFATSYIPTTSSTATRNADVATMTGANFSNWYNPSEGTITVACNTLSPTSSPIIYTFSDGTANNRIQSNADTGFHLFVASGGVTQASIDAGTFVANTIEKLAAAYKLNDFAAAIDGGAVGTDVLGTVPTVNRLNIGSGATGGSPLNGHVQSIAYYNKRLSDTQLQALTR